MEKNSSSQEMVESEKEREEKVEEEEEEYVLLDLDSVSEHISIPPNAPYVLSGLDTVHPILMIDNKIKLIGEYEETIGTCLAFKESDGNPIVRKEEAEPSGAKQTPTKQVNPMAQLNKVLKFRLYLEPDGVDEADKQTDRPS